MPTTDKQAVYGAAPHSLATIPVRAAQCSPLVPGAAALEDAPDGSLGRIVVAAPPGVLERRYVLAQGLRALKAGGELVALAPKTKGGARLRKELEAFGCQVAETAKQHQRICVCVRPVAPSGIEAAIAAGGPQQAPALGLWSQPGIFSWDRPDAGTALLAPLVGDLAGAGADLGCGAGALSLAALVSPKLTRLTLIDIDRRAIEAARRNIADPRAALLQADLRDPTAPLSGLDFVIMNPPFHLGAREDRGLGQTFIARAAAMLRKGGVCRMVANVGLPYEAALGQSFSRVAALGQGRGYKLFEGVR
ncbi:MAG TPA: methyltransferase [Caulobacteraceae bacterium]|jgi:16S rRNA (guanine1207-N2)-methyltransferase|nr:methyltransferase [Caulobacteraceae bacterium]